MDRKGNNRKDWVDFLRGIAMLMVLWGHINRTGHLFFAITSPFKMPLFFAITGYLFKDRNGNVKEFFYKLFRTIIVPWFVLSLIWLKVLYGIVIGNPDLIQTYLYNFVSGSDFWFMPCIIISNTLFFFTKKMIHSTSGQYLTMAMLSIFGVVLNKYGVARFAMFDVACTSQAFYLFGYWFKNNEAKLRTDISRPKVIILLFSYASLVAASLLFYPTEIIDVHMGKYYNYPLCLAMIIVSMLVLFIEAPNIKRYPQWVLFVGQNTIIFYICHYHARSLLIHALNVLHISLSSNYFGYGIRFVIICIAMSVLSAIINTYFPYVLGRGKIVRSNPN